MQLPATSFVRIGDGMYNYDSSPWLTGCTFSGNWVSSNGGAFYVGDGNPHLSECAFEQNSANNGGTVHNRAGSASEVSSASVGNCRFIGNSAIRIRLSGGSLGAVLDSGDAYLDDFAVEGGTVR